MTASTDFPTAEGPGSVSEAPNLPEGFTDTFTSRYVDTGELRQHGVIGDGPPLLLVHGWPENCMLGVQLVDGAGVDHCDRPDRLAVPVVVMAPPGPGAPVTVMRRAIERTEHGCREPG